MTRIITEKYNCANCNNELHRDHTIEVFDFVNSDIILDCYNTFVGYPPKLYCCEKCGYIGRDLSIKPNKEIQEIIDSAEYKLLMEIGDRYNAYFKHFLLGYILLKLHKYKEAIPHFICSINGGCRIFLDQNRLLDDVVLYEDIDFDIVANNSMELDNLYANHLIVECIKHIDYAKEDSFLLFYESIDALRRVGKPEVALVLIKIALNRKFDKEQIALINKEQELCEKNEVLTIIKILDEDEYHRYGNK